MPETGMTSGMVARVHRVADTAVVSMEVVRMDVVGRLSALARKVVD